MVGVLALVEPHIRGPGTRDRLNVPSADILDAGKLYFETDHYFGATITGGERAKFFLFAASQDRREHGAGSTWARSTTSTPANPSSMWHQVAAHAETCRQDGGNFWIVPGRRCRQRVPERCLGRFRNLAYAAGFLELNKQDSRRALLRDTPRLQPIDGGSELRSRSSRRSPGLEGWKLAADWFSGDGALATAGVIWSTGRSTLYAGYVSRTRNPERSRDARVRTSSILTAGTCLIF